MQSSMIQYMNDVFVVKAKEYPWNTVFLRDSKLDSIFSITLETRILVGEEINFNLPAPIMHAFLNAHTAPDAPFRAVFSLNVDLGQEGRSEIRVYPYLLGSNGGSISVRVASYTTDKLNALMGFFLPYYPPHTVRDTVRNEESRKALLMALHPRLGAASALGHSLTIEILRSVLVQYVDFSLDD